MADVTLYHLRINPITGNAYMADQGSSPAMPQYVLATDYEALRKRCEAVEADAARYRWLRANAVVGRMESRGPRPDFAMNCDEPESEWDACIDSHIAAAQEPSHG